MKGRAVYSAVVAFAFLLVGCAEKNDPDTSMPDVILRTSVVGYTAGEMFITVDVPGEWTIFLDFGGKQPWAELGVSSGNGRRVDVDLYYQENGDEDRNRTFKIVVSYSGGTIVKEFTQHRKSSSDPITSWMELPAVSLSDGQYFFTHRQILSTRESVRSWSYLWDTAHLVSHWIAYPLTTKMIGQGSRTDEWGLDPKLSRDEQPVLFNPYSRYQRGHQIPSADRLNYEANVQTFYGTNMTPQEGGLNGGVWARLEGKVRDWASSFDTLYVVTGCVVTGSTETVKDNDNKDVTVPTAYFKALLGYSKKASVGMTPQTGGYTGVAFYMSHRSYPSDYLAAAMTIRELERKTGFDFFVNLPSAITTANAEKVETLKDNFWYD